MLLRTLTFVSSADEPPSVTRRIVIAVSDAENVQNCTIRVPIILINDNAPIVDLSGPTRASINHSVSLSYTYFEPVGVSIAASDVSITDADGDSRIISLNVTLEPNRPEDRLQFNLCQDSDGPTCHLRYSL